MLHPWHAVSGVPIDIDTHLIPATPDKGEGRHVHFDFRYVLLLEVAQEVELDRSEVLDHRWVPLEDVPSDASIHPAARKVMEMGL